MTKNNTGKIACIPDTFEILITTAENDEESNNPSVTLRVVRSGTRYDFSLTPEAARELAEALNEGADEADEAEED